MSRSTLSSLYVPLLQNVNGTVLKMATIGGKNVHGQVVATVPNARVVSVQLAFTGTVVVVSTTVAPRAR